MITEFPETNKGFAETESEANDMVPIQKSKEKKSGKSLGSAESKKAEAEDNIEIGDDVALTFPQRVSDDKRMLPRGLTLFELPMCSNKPQFCFQCSFPKIHRQDTASFLELTRILLSNLHSSWRFSTMKLMPILLPGFPTVVVL
jgi:hypothetical protein